MLNIPISVGELIDKITILEIKKEKIKDNDKLKKVEKELEELNKLNTFDIHEEYKELKNINLKLWEIEDDIRIKERKKEFDDEFIELARSVYKTNDQRFNIKNIINIKLKSSINEVKSYEEF